jgi:hypothetical protein
MEICSLASDIDLIDPADLLFRVSTLTLWGLRFGLLALLMQWPRCGIVNCDGCFGGLQLLIC